MFSIHVNADALKALALLASVDALRPHICGVCIDTTTPGRVHLVSTDGHRMLIVNNTTAEGDIAPGLYTLPLFDVKGAKPASKHAPITIDILPGNPGRFTIKGKSEITGTLCDGRFPPWQRVTPVTTSGKLAHFNLGYVGDFGRVAELLGVKYPAIQHNGESAALVNLGADAFGILMPMRADHIAETASPPVWVKPDGVEVAQAA
jgi:hypothetical protein